MALRDTKTRDIPAQMMRAALGSVNEEARTVEVVWTTGAKVLRSNWDIGPFFEELSLDPKHVRMGRLNSGAPFLANHNGYDVARTLGVIESATLNGTEGRALVRFAKAEDDPEADKVFRKIKDKIIRNVSVGYRIHKVEKIEAADEKIPTLRVVDWEPHEISAVAIGADDGAGFRSDDARQSNPCEFLSRSTENTEMPPKTPEQIAAELAQRTAEIQAAKDEAVRAERERHAEITRACRALGADASAFAQKLIADDKMTVAVAQSRVLEVLAERSEKFPPAPNGNHITVTDDAADKQARGMEAWLIEKAGARDVVERAQKSGAKGLEKVALDGGEFRGASMADLARRFLQARGVVPSYGMDPVKDFARAYNYRSGYASTSDFSVLFENVMNKVLLAAYATQPDSWRSFCKVESVQDFRDSNRFRTGALTVLDSLNELGEFKNKPIPDGEKSVINVATKGNIIALSRQAVISDDMGALGDLAQKLGRAAALSIETDVYALLSANSGAGATFGGQNFFYSGGGNLGTAGAHSAAEWDKDRQLMALQKDINNQEYLDLRPSILVCGIQTETAARVLNAAQYEPTADMFEKPNAAAGMFRTIVGTPRVAGTKRYMFCDPNVAAAIVVAFLNGQQAPFLESDEGFRVDGTEYKVRLDYKAQFFDRKAGVYNPGA